jgi:hypothetical protein
VSSGWLFVVSLYYFLVDYDVFSFLCFTALGLCFVTLNTDFQAEWCQVDCLLHGSARMALVWVVMAFGC